MENNQQIDKFVNLLEKETYIDTLKEDEDIKGFKKHFTAALKELCDCFETDTNDDQYNQDMAELKAKFIQVICNSIHICGNQYKNKLEDAVAQLSLAEQDNQGTEFSDQQIQRAVEMHRRRHFQIYIMRNCYGAAAFDVHPVVIDEALDALPDGWEKYLSRQHQPWVPKDQYMKKMNNKKATFARAEAQAILKQYKS